MGAPAAATGWGPRCWARRGEEGHRDLEKARLPAVPTPGVLIPAPGPQRAPGTVFLLFTPEKITSPTRGLTGLDRNGGHTGIRGCAGVHASPDAPAGPKHQPGSAVGPGSLRLSSRLARSTGTRSRTPPDGGNELSSRPLLSVPLRADPTPGPRGHWERLRWGRCPLWEGSARQPGGRAGRCRLGRAPGAVSSCPRLRQRPVQLERLSLAPQTRARPGQQRPRSQPGPGPGPARRCNPGPDVSPQSAPGGREQRALPRPQPPSTPLSCGPASRTPFPRLARADPDIRAQSVPPPPGRPPGLIGHPSQDVQGPVPGGAVPRSPERGQGEAEVGQGREGGSLVTSYSGSAEKQCPAALCPSPTPGCPRRAFQTPFLCPGGSAQLDPEAGDARV